MRQMADGKVLHVEIVPALKGQRTVTISTGANGTSSSRQVTVGSLQQLMRLLSETNVALLHTVRDCRPTSVAELARLTGRPKASLTQTLRRLERFGLITFRQSHGRRKMPEIACDKVTLDVVIGNGEASVAPAQTIGMSETVAE